MLPVYNPSKKAMGLRTRKTFTDVGASVAKLLGVKWSGQARVSINYSLNRVKSKL